MRLPLYYDGGAGRNFAMAFLPEAADALRWSARGLGVVVAPPFAEEMNKSRRTLSLLGAALARDGVPVLLPDLHGTGDSAGEFADARWDIWSADLLAAVELMVSRGAARVAVLGLRLGALLALDTAAADTPRVSHLLLWQPVISGRQYVTQFLRLGVAAALAGGGTDTVTAIRGRLASDGIVEIGGYALSRELASAIEERELAAAPRPAQPVRWFEVSVDPRRPLAGPAQALVDLWRAQGADVDCTPVAGDAFWATQEIAEAPRLIEATATCLLALGGPT